MNNKEQKILSKLTILYIEDEDVIRENITETLSMIFKNVISFRDAEDGIKYFKSNLPDMILSDINLPNMSGIEFSKEIRKVNKNIPIILLTAYTNTEILLEATRLKLINYLIKPVIFEELFNSFKLAINDIEKEENDILEITNSITYDLSKKLLYEGTSEIHLSSSENKLLMIFIKYKSVTISIIEIKNLLWDDPYDATDSAFKSVLNKLRTKIGKDTIKNVPGVGYYLSL